MAVAPKKRIYTTVDDRVDHALELVSTVGATSPDASSSEKLRVLVHIAEEHLSEQVERTERIAAYDELAKDEDRSQAIRASVLNAAKRGVL